MAQVVKYTILLHVDIRGTLVSALICKLFMHDFDNNYYLRIRQCIIMQQ